MNIYIFLILASFIRLMLASLFPLTADESYYWLWSKHLSLSYVDHPPMIALVNYLFTLGHENLLLLRLGAVLITLFISLFLFLLTKELFGEKIAFWSVVLFQILPHYVVVWLTQFVELPLALFWTLSLLIIVKILKTTDQRPKTIDLFLWCLLGITVGLGCLSKYTMFLFWPCFALFLFSSPESRRKLFVFNLCQSLCLSLFVFLPVLYWNSQNSWASFAFHGAKATGEPWGTNFLPFIGDQLIHFTPFLIFPLFSIAKWGFRKNEKTKLLASFSFPLLLLFLCLSLKVKVWAHWPSIGYIAVLPLSVAYLAEKMKPAGKLAISIACFTVLVLSLLFFLSPGILLHQDEYANNYRLAKKIPSEFKLFSKTNVSSSLLEFYLKRQTYMATGFLKSGHPWGEKQYDVWGTPNLKKGESIYYYGENNADFQKLVLAYFSSMKELPEVRLNLIEDYISKHYRFFLLENYKGDSGHP